MPGLYDQYRLSNSTVVPQFMGTTAPEALKVGAHLQELYDTAKSGANTIMSATDGLRSMVQDDPLKREVVGKISGDIDNMTNSRDWENQTDAVTSLGRWYAQRSMELEAPIKQYTEWAKGLDEKDRNLTTKMREDYDAMARAGYKGLTKNSKGQFEGSFNGPELAKNIDVPKRVDTWISNAAHEMGATEVANDNGIWKYKKNGKWDIFKPETIRNILGSAMSLDKEYQDYKGMLGDHSGFRASRVTDISQVDPSLLPDVQAGIARGESLQEASSKAYRNSIMDNVDRTARNYGIDKYSMNNQWNGVETSIGAVETAKRIDDLKNGPEVGDLITGSGNSITPYASPKDAEKEKTTAETNLAASSTKLKALNNTIAKAQGVDISKLTKENINAYFQKNPNLLGDYNATNNAITSSNATIKQVNDIIDESRDASVRKTAPGTSYITMRNDATTKLKEVLAKSPAFMAGLKLSGIDIKGAEVVDGGTNELGRYIVVRGSNGIEHNVPLISESSYEESKVLGSARAKKGSSSSLDLSALNTVADNFSKVKWKDSYQEIIDTKTSTIKMPVEDIQKAGSYSNRIKAVLSADPGSLTLHNAIGIAEPIDDKTRSRILSGDYKVRAIEKGKGGKLQVRIAVLVDNKADDSADKYEEIIVSGDSNLVNKMADLTLKSGKLSGDQRQIDFGNLLTPGSSYEQLSNAGSSDIFQINDISTKDKKGAPLYQITPNRSNGKVTYVVHNLDSKGALTGEGVEFTDMARLSTLLDENRVIGRELIKK